MADFREGDRKEIDHGVSAESLAIGEWTSERGDPAVSAAYEIPKPLRSAFIEGDRVHWELSRANRYRPAK